jgi:hypothetical protein
MIFFLIFLMIFFCTVIVYHSVKHKWNQKYYSVQDWNDQNMVLCVVVRLGLVAINREERLPHIGVPVHNDVGAGPSRKWVDIG